MPDEEHGGEGVRKRVEDALRDESPETIANLQHAAREMADAAARAGGFADFGIKGSMTLSPDVVQARNSAKLVDLNEEVSEQLVALAQITGAALEESRQLRETMTAAAEEQRSATNASIRLAVALTAFTVVLILLTYLLVADVRGWWPFPAA